MTTETFLWLIGQAIVITGVIIGAYLKLIDRISVVAERVIKVEVTLDLIGVNAAKILHRDDDKYGVDDLLERYIKNHNNLSMSEWEMLHCEMNKISTNEKAPKSERTLAAFLSALAVHKMGAYLTESRKMKI